MDQQVVEQEDHSNSQLNRFRRHPRVRIPAPFTCALSPIRPRRWLRKPIVDVGLVYDLSLRGARVSTQAAIRPGDEVTLRLRLPKQIKTADITLAKVRWTKDHFCGLAFTRLPASSYSRLKKYVAIVSGSVAAA
ncbi:MAG TPA: PilZ domain-containing protein [Nitrospira sp.]|nr:PilZ domain-containing protein [Nitrospira sp.]